MDLDRLLSDLRITAAAPHFAPHWDESVRSLGDAVPWFLDPAEVETAAVYAGFAPGVREVLASQAARIGADPALRRLAWHCHALLYTHLDYAATGEWPAELDGPFYLIVALSMVRGVRTAHACRGIEDAVTRATCSQLSCFSLNYAGMSAGKLGIPRSQLYWTRHYPAGRLYRVGRMEYMVAPYRGTAVAYRHSPSGAVVALAAPGLICDDDGYAAPEGAPGWHPDLVVDARGAVGYPVSPEGRVTRRRARLECPAWTRVLAPGDPVLDMHIPAGGAMTLDACAESLRNAVGFFRRRFGHDTARAVACHSWIFNTQLQRIAEGTRNLAAFQRELYLFPVPSDGRDGLWFIYLSGETDPARLPRDTSLRRGVADFLATGERWRSGGMFILPEDLDRFGRGTYTTGWPPPGLVWV